MSCSRCQTLVVRHHGSDVSRARKPQRGDQMDRIECGDFRRVDQLGRCQRLVVKRQERDACQEPLGFANEINAKRESEQFDTQQPTCGAIAVAGDRVKDCASVGFTKEDAADCAGVEVDPRHPQSVRSARVSAR